MVFTSPPTASGKQRSGTHPGELLNAHLLAVLLVLVASSWRP